jgi:hypothetical protein
LPSDLLSHRQTRVKPVLVEMKGDADSDVQYYAGQALKKC